LFATQTAKVKSCLLVNDGEVYGQRLAQAFSTTAKANGIAITDLGTWDKGANSYLAMFAGMEGNDCVYLSGNFDNNGAELVSDKIALLGSNDKVKLFVPDGFALYPAFVQSPAAQHAYVTLPGLTMDAWRSLSGPSAAFLSAYHATYSTDLTSPEAMYGVLALQMVLRAMAISDGSRVGVHQAMLSGSGVSLPADTSLTGVPTAIVPATGDVNPQLTTVGQVNKGAISFVSTSKLT
jgi:branched-chain amino acid transport system substrate-binding protein